MASANKLLRETNKSLDAQIQSQHETITNLDIKQRSCKQKCEVAISEKERILKQKEEYIQSLKGTIWHLQNSYLCKFYGFVETPEGFKFNLEFHRKPQS